jgi:hypothetical protein
MALYVEPYVAVISFPVPRLPSNPVLPGLYELLVLFPCGCTAGG